MTCRDARQVSNNTSAQVASPSAATAKTINEDPRRYSARDTLDSLQVRRGIVRPRRQSVNPPVWSAGVIRRQPSVERMRHLQLRIRKLPCTFTR